MRLLSAAKQSSAIALLALALNACSPPPQPITNALESGELVVITYNSATTFYQDADGKYAGLEYDLVRLFANELGVKVKFIVAQKFNQILPALQKHQVHFAAAGLNVTANWLKHVQFGVPYQTVKQQVAYQSDKRRPTSMSDLVGKRIEVVAGSDAIALLKHVKKNTPGLVWTEVATHGSFDLLERLADDKVDFVVADSHVVDITNNFFPNVAAAFDIGNPHQIAWAFPENGDPTLSLRAKEFFAKIIRDGTLKRILDRYYGHIRRLDQTDVTNFLEKSQLVLPRYKRFFYEAQDISDIDWRLLAAISFHESHWDPLATSYTGVRGIMMLTSDTADRMNVTDRLDPKQSIIAGAKYLALLKETIPARIPEPDRTWLAVAAYNVGYGHLEDARVLAQRQRLNPDSWTDIKKTLPLLSKSSQLTALKHGFARGGEPVIMTEDIRTYFDILAKFEKPYRPALVSPGPDITVTRKLP